MARAAFFVVVVIVVVVVACARNDIRFGAACDDDRDCLPTYLCLDVCVPIAVIGAVDDDACRSECSDDIDCKFDLEGPAICVGGRCLSECGTDDEVCTAVSSDWGPACDENDDCDDGDVCVPVDLGLDAGGDGLCAITSLDGDCFVAPFVSLQRVDVTGRTVNVCGVEGVCGGRFCEERLCVGDDDCATGTCSALP